MNRLNFARSLKSPPPLAKKKEKKDGPWQQQKMVTDALTTAPL